MVTNLLQRLFVNDGSDEVVSNKEVATSNTNGKKLKRK